MGNWGDGDKVISPWGSDDPVASDSSTGTVPASTFLHNSGNMWTGALKGLGGSALGLLNIPADAYNLYANLVNRDTSSNPDATHFPTLGYGPGQAHLGQVYPVQQPQFLAPKPEEKAGYLYGNVLGNVASMFIPGGAEKVAPEVLRPAITGLDDITKLGPTADAIEAGSKALGTKLMSIPAKATGDISGQALLKASTPAGRADLAAVAGQEKQLGQGLVSDVFHPPETYVEFRGTTMPEEQAVSTMLKNMPAIKPDNLVQSLQDATLKHPMTEGDYKINGQIQTILSSIKDQYGIKDADGVLTGYKDIPASDYRDLRMRLDNDIPFDAPWRDQYERALLQARTGMKSDLISSASGAGYDEYAPLMESVSDKLTKLDRAKQVLGRNEATANMNASRKVMNLFNPGNEAQVDAIGNLQSVLGRDPLPDFLNAQFARKLGMADKDALGNIGNIPLTGSGSAKWDLAHLASFPVSSPWTATHITIPLARGVGTTLPFTTKLVPAAGLTALEQAYPYSADPNTIGGLSK